MEKIWKIYATRSDNGIMIYDIKYKSGRHRLEVERLLPETAKEFIRQNQGNSYVIYHAVTNRYETVYG